MPPLRRCQFIGDAPGRPSAGGLEELELEEASGPGVVHRRRCGGPWHGPPGPRSGARPRRRLVRVVHGRSAPRRAEPVGPPGQAVEGPPVAVR